MSKGRSGCLHEVGLIPQRVNIAREHQPRLLHQDVESDRLVAVGGDPDALDGEVGDAAHDGCEDRVVQIPGGYLGEGVTRWALAQGGEMVSWMPRRTRRAYRVSGVGAEQRFVSTSGALKRAHDPLL